MRWLRVAAAVFGLLLLASCGGGNPPSATPSRTPGAVHSPTATVPSPTRTAGQPVSPARTRPPPERTRTPTPSQVPQPGPTGAPSTEPAPPRSPVPTATIGGPATVPTPAATTPTTASSPTVAAPPPTPAGSAQGPTAAAGAPTWPWWLLAAVVVLALAVGILLLVRRRRRKEWLVSLAAAEADVAWLAHDLLPGLRRSGSRERAGGAWEVSSDRVVGLEDRLAALQVSAPDEEYGGRALALRDSVRAARARIDELLRQGADDAGLAGLDDVSADLDAALPLPSATDTI